MWHVRTSSRYPGRVRSLQSARGSLGGEGCLELGDAPVLLVHGAHEVQDAVVPARKRFLQLLHALSQLRAEKRGGHERCNGAREALGRAGGDEIQPITATRAWSPERGLPAGT